MTLYSTFLTCGVVFLSSSSIDALAINVEPLVVNGEVKKETSININQNVIIVSGRMSLGLINGESQELVYVPEINHKLSQLNWEIDEVAMLNLGGSVSPTPWLNINADVSFKINEGNGTMDDYDWFIKDFTFTHWSHHEDVDLTKGMMLDINAEAKVYEFENSRFYGIAGFKYDNWEWKAYGGDYYYSTYYLYDTVGSFPDGELGITYEQKFYAPYIGIGYSSNFTSIPLTLSGRVIGSFFVFGEDKDQHHMRDLIFEEDFDSGNMIAVDLAASYYFTNALSVTLLYHYQDFMEMKGETTITDIITGEVTKYTGDVAGMSHRSNSVSLSAQYTF